ncbi:MAG: TRCF domain-containing protein [Rickettsiales bacterium]
MPDARMAVAHGQMPMAALEEVMNGFVEGRYDILLSTHIVEAGLDIPKANTIIVHRADRFGLSQLYQLRGRVGRSKVRAYAYLTLPPGQTVTPTALRRLEVMQALDTLGAGFSLASHDLDIRGAGNLLGDEQSGHIREVGVELYQHMLEETIAALRDSGEVEEEAWTPQISLGTSVLIPESYVSDLSVRLGLYRRLSLLVGQEEIEAFAAELIDRFGPLPQEVENLLEVMAVKQLCRIAGVEQIDAGPKGAVISFRNNTPPNPERLIGYIQRQARSIKLRPDQKVVYLQNWSSADVRVKGAHRLMSDLAALVEG